MCPFVNRGPSWRLSHERWHQSYRWFDLDEWNYIKKTADMSDDVPKVVKSLEPEVVLNMGREMRPIMSELQVARIKKALDTGDVAELYGKQSRQAASVEPPLPNGDNGVQETHGP